MEIILSKPFLSAHRQIKYVSLYWLMRALPTEGDWPFVVITFFPAKERWDDSRIRRSRARYLCLVGWITDTGVLLQCPSPFHHSSVQLHPSGSRVSCVSANFLVVSATPQHPCPAECSTYSRHGRFQIVSFCGSFYFLLDSYPLTVFRRWLLVLCVARHLIFCPESLGCTFKF